LLKEVAELNHLFACEYIITKFKTNGILLFLLVDMFVKDMFVKVLLPLIETNLPLAVPLRLCSSSLHKHHKQQYANGSEKKKKKTSEKRSRVSD